MKKLKRTMAVWLILLLAAMLAACAEAPGEQGLSICIVTTSGVNDRSFGQDCYNGILAYIDANPDATVKTIEERDMDKAVDVAAQLMADYDVLVLPGYQFSPIGELARDYPDTKVILIDAAPSNADGETLELDNVYSMVFQEEESGFYAGVAAALETKSGKVASVHGMTFPSNINFQYGFISGVNYSNRYFGTKAQVIELPPYAGIDMSGNNIGGNYIGAFDDQETGKLIADALIAAGCDVIFAAAGDSGNGVFAAVKQAKDVFVIGVDVDQFDDGERRGGNIVLTSVLKVMGPNITLQLEKIAKGMFAGENALLGTSKASTAYVSTEGRQQMRKETLASLREVQVKIMQGDIIPASSSNGYSPDSFPGY